MSTDTAVQKPEETNCPCCPNHCPAESLGCVRGMAHFERTITEDWLFNHRHPDGGPSPQQQEDPNAPVADRIVAALQACGRAMHHGGGGSAEKLLSGLTEQEQEELLRLLEKVKQNLPQQRPGGPGGGHGEPDGPGGRGGRHRI